jgi:hypothetical protein
VRGKRTGVALLLVVALAGCGSSGDDSGPGLTSGQSQGLVAQLEAARATAAARDVAATKAAIDDFRRSVARLRRAGALTDAQARALRIGAARVLARVRSDNAPPQQPAPVLTETAPAPAPPGHEKKHEEKKHEEKKPGKGHGEKHGEGDD